MVVSEILTKTEGVWEYKGVDVLVGPACHDPGCRGYGSDRSGVVFVGIAPGQHEVKSGRPLTGPSGKLLDAVLDALSLSRKDVYCTNLICWWKDDPSRQEADGCAQRLDAELRALRPKLIILLGGIVTDIFLGRTLGKSRGAVQWNEKYSCYVMPTYHPAAILRGMGQYSSSKDDKASALIYDFVRDIKKIPNILKWDDNAPLADISYTVVDNPSDAQRVLDSFGDEIVALDVETKYEKDNDETEALEDLLLCVGVGTVDHAWVFTPSALYRANDDGAQVPALVWPDLKWVMHYAIFDTQIMKRCLGVWIDVKEDTLLQSYSLDERSGIHKLKPLSREFLGAPFYEEGKNESPEKLYEYNAHDVVYTARLCRLFSEWQRDDNVREFYENILIPTVNIFKELQYRGTNVDQSLLIQFGAMWGQQLMELETELQDVAEEEGFIGRINLNSTDQLGTLLFTLLSLPIVKRTPKGAPCVDKDVLEALEDQHPFVKRLREYRTLAHMFDIYIAGFIRQIKKKGDARAHAITKLHGSRTGRPSYTKPPLQTIPVPYEVEGRATEFGGLRKLFKVSDIKWVREWNAANGLWVPPEDDEMVFIEADFGKAELWMAYAVSGDEVIHQGLISADYHKKVASETIFHKPYDEVTGGDKLIAKRVNFGILYDIEQYSLSKLIKCSPPEAGAYIRAVRERNAGYEKWARETQKRMKDEGELVTASGRKRRIIILGDGIRALKQAVNFPIQSTASDVLMCAVIELHNILKSLGGHLLFTVHDSILLEVPRSRLQEALQYVHDAMTRKRYPSVPPLPIEISIGDSWGTTQHYHDCAQDASRNKGLGGRCLY